MEKYWDALESLNPWWQGPVKGPPVYPRPAYTERLLSHPGHIIDVLIGARRVGKTYILKSCIHELLKTQSPDTLMYLTAELPVLANVDLADLIEAFKRRGKKGQKKTIFIDEIQEIKNWQMVLKYYVDTDNIKFFVTGSSSLILNQQTARLTGRYLTTHVFPLGYSEFLLFKSKLTAKAWKPNAKTVIDYLEMGGYPDYVLTGNPQLLIETTESILYRDLLSLHGIRNPALLKTLLQFLCDKVTTPLSSTTIAKDLRIDPQTAASYLKYLQDVYLVYPLYRQGKSHRIVKGSTPKYYLNDTGILKLFSQVSRIGHLAENAVFLRFFREATRLASDVYYDVADEREIDFVIKNKKYDVKFKPISEPHSDMIYVVPEVDSHTEAKQIPLWQLLSAIAP